MIENGGSVVEVVGKKIKKFRKRRRSTTFRYLLAGLAVVLSSSGDASFRWLLHGVVLFLLVRAFREDLVEIEADPALACPHCGANMARAGGHLLNVVGTCESCGREIFDVQDAPANNG